MRGYGVWGFFGEVIPILCQEVLVAFEKCGLATYIAEQVANQLNKQLNTSMISTGIEDEKLRAILRAVLKLALKRCAEMKPVAIGCQWRISYKPCAWYASWNLWQWMGKLVKNVGGFSLIDK